MNLGGHFSKTKRTPSWMELYRWNSVLRGGKSFFSSWLFCPLFVLLSLYPSLYTWHTRMRQEWYWSGARSSLLLTITGEGVRCLRQCGALLQLIKGRRWSLEWWKHSYQRKLEWEEMGLQLLLHYTMGGSNWRPSLQSMVQNFLEESQATVSVSVYWELIYISIELGHAT